MSGNKKNVCNHLDIADKHEKTASKNTFQKATIVLDNQNIFQFTIGHWNSFYYINRILKQNYHFDNNNNDIFMVLNWVFDFRNVKVLKIFLSTYSRKLHC